MPPKKVRILGLEYKVRYVPLDDACGDFDDSGTIRIDPTSSKANQSHTLAHEYAHGLWAAVQGPEVKIEEETFARMFSAGVADLVRNNWALIMWLKEGK